MENWTDAIRFTSGDEDAKKRAIETVDKAINKERALFDSETLYHGLKEYTEDLVVTIKDEDTYYNVDLSPKSGAGHDFSFSVDKETLEVNDMAVGELIPDPEEEEYERLEGKYHTEIDYEEHRALYDLKLYGPTNSKYSYGERFTLSREELIEDEGGQSETISGSYEINGDKLCLTGEKLEDESWDKDGNAEGEAFIDDFDGDEIIAGIDLSGDDPTLRLDRFLDPFDKPIELKKIEKKGG